MAAASQLSCAASGGSCLRATADGAGSRLPFERRVVLPDRPCSPAALVAGTLAAALRSCADFVAIAASAVSISAAVSAPRRHACFRDHQVVCMSTFCTKPVTLAAKGCTAQPLLHASGRCFLNNL